MLHRLRIEEGWSTLFLVWAMVFIAGMALIQADWFGGMEITTAVGTFGVLTGLLLAKSRFSNRTAHLLSLVYGLFVLAYFIGLILPGELGWRERVLDMASRQFLWIRKAFGEGTNRDGPIFVMHTAAIFWLLGYFASWYTFRYPRVWRAILPTALVLLSVVYYYYGPRPLVIYLGLFAVVALLYVSQTHLVMQEKLWRANIVRFERGIQLTFLRSSLIAGSLAIIVAWSLPALTASATVADAVNSVNSPWRHFQDNWTRLYSSLRSYGTGTSDPYQDTLVLGGPRNVGDTLIMDIYVKQRLPYAYWQAYALDTYEDGRWTTTEGEQVLHFPDDGLLRPPATQAREVITQTVVNYMPSSSILYGLPEVVGSDRQMYVTRSMTSQGEPLITSLQSRLVLKQGDFYQMTSQFSVADATSLRQASTNYPAWIAGRYLQVPDTLTPETIALSNELAAPYDNPFDTAIAVRDYLRNNITYNDQIPGAPQGMDPVHYTLFVSRQGYCNYYASSMAMLLRLQGIPARVVSGYAQGEWIEDGAFYRVRAFNAHTWVEVYFTGYGWIQFEPTASIPTVERPETPGGGDNFGNIVPPVSPPDREALLGEDLNNSTGEIEDPNPLGQDQAAGDGLGNLSSATLLEAAIGVLILGLAGGAVLAVNQFNLRVESDVRRSYGRLESWGRRLGLPISPAHTPYERANLLTRAVPEGRAPIRNLTRHFVLRTFSRLRGADEPFNPREEWKRLRPILLRSTVAHWFAGLRRRRR